MHFQPSELDVMDDEDIDFWLNQLYIEFDNQKKAIDKNKSKK